MSLLGLTSGGLLSRASDSGQDTSATDTAAAAADAPVDPVGVTRRSGVGAFVVALGLLPLPAHACCGCSGRLQQLAYWLAVTAYVSFFAVTAWVVTVETRAAYVITLLPFAAGLALYVGMARFAASSLPAVVHVAHQAAGWEDAGEAKAFAASLRRVGHMVACGVVGMLAAMVRRCGGTGGGGGCVACRRTARLCCALP
jgi:hypothetical protein